LTRNAWNLSDCASGSSLPRHFGNDKITHCLRRQPLTASAHPPSTPASCSDRDQLDLVERDLVTGAIVEFSRARAFMRRHGLGILERGAGLEIGSDAGGGTRVEPAG